MARILGNWLTEYVSYASHTEAPEIMHWWAGVGALAGALRRKVWVEQFYFQWTPCFFILFVAPPGVVSKSTTADIAMDLLREVPGIIFGPNIATWESLLPAFAAAGEVFLQGGSEHPMAPLTFCASELGNLVDLANSDLVNLFITLWDGKKSLTKITKGNGSDHIESPWINMVGCTTPQWIAQNMTSLTVGGGFASRCVFVFADKKDRLIPWPGDDLPAGQEQTRKALIADLTHIAALCGPFTRTEAANLWVEAWYENTWENRPDHLLSDQADGYVARRQTHLVKIAMVLSAAEKDDLVLTLDNFTEANRVLVATEKSFHRVFEKIGKSETSLQIDRVIEQLRRRKELSYVDVHRIMHKHFPDQRDLAGMLQGIINAGYGRLEQRADGFVLYWAGRDE